MNTSIKNIIVNFRVDVKDKEILDSLARAKGVNTSDLIRESIKNYLKNEVFK